MMIALGIQGLITGDFMAVWPPVPKGVPAREALLYICAAISLASGIGLLLRLAGVIAARLLLVWLVVWFLVWRVRALFIASLVESTWSCGETLAMMAAAWVLYAWFATDLDRRRVGFATGASGLRIARVLYGLALFPFGYAHFAYLKHTADMVPGWPAELSAISVQLCSAGNHRGLRRVSCPGVSPRADRAGGSLRSDDSDRRARGPDPGESRGGSRSDGGASPRS